MARSLLIAPTNDLIADSGAVLWSFVKGEQLEFPITLSFIKDTTAEYTYEAVVVEGANDLAAQPPIAIEPLGIQTVLTIRVPQFVGIWNGAAAYNKENVVLYVDKYYRLLGGAARIYNLPPDQDSYWEETTTNTVYVQFPKNLGSDWKVAPTVSVAVYGFFELRVTEPLESTFTRTWKPVRGMVELLFSPTDITPDI